MSHHRYALKANVDRSEPGFAPGGEIIPGVPRAQLRDLDGMLAGAQRVPQQLAAFSSWLAQFIPVALVAHWNPRRRNHYLVCQDESPARSQLLSEAWEVIEGPLPRILHWRKELWFFHIWLGVPLARGDRLLIVERGLGLPAEEANLLMREALEVLEAPLRQALDAGR